MVYFGGTRAIFLDPHNIPTHLSATRAFHPRLAQFTGDPCRLDTPLFEGNTESESNSKASDARRKNETPRRGLKIVTHKEIQGRNRKRIPQNKRKTTARHTRVWDEWAHEQNSLTL